MEAKRQDTSCIYRAQRRRKLARCHRQCERKLSDQASFCFE